MFIFIVLNTFIEPKRRKTFQKNIIDKITLDSKEINNELFDRLKQELLLRDVPLMPSPQETRHIQSNNTENNQSYQIENILKNPAFIKGISTGFISGLVLYLCFI
jgi:hypothetical protein